MQLPQLAPSAQRLLDTRLFEIRGMSVTPSSLVVFSVMLGATLVLARVVRMGAERALSSRASGDIGSARVVGRLLSYFVVVLGIGMSLDTLGVNIVAFFTAGAFFAVAVGFAMQNITQNFLSGVILLVERSLKPGDVLEVDGRVVRIEHLGLRATIARTRDDEDLIIPNAMLAQQIVTNYTLRDSMFRVRSTVDVSYATDVDDAFRALRAAADAVEERLEQPEPRVLLTSFGSSGIAFEISVWVQDPWGARGTLSRLNQAIWRGLKEAGITIPFPQLDLHLDPRAPGVDANPDAPPTADPGQGAQGA